MSGSGPRLECAICLDNCLNGVRLDCNHVFCFLCVKGSVQQSSNRCPICRQSIAVDYFDNPTLIENVDWRSVPRVTATQWQYEGRNGWWLYDTRSLAEIDKALAEEKDKLEVLIAGFVYIIDFDKMIQYRKDQPNRIRRIRRHPIEPNSTKGVAGIKIFADQMSDNDDDSDQLNGTALKDNIVADGHQNETNDTTDETNSEPNDTQRSAEAEVETLGQSLSANLNLNESRETYL